MEPASSDYMSVNDLSRPRKTTLQAQLEKIDPSIIRNGIPTSQGHRKGYARQKNGQETRVFEISVLAFREIILHRHWKNDRRFLNESDFCKHQWNILKPRKTLLIEYAEVLTELSGMPIRPCTEQVCKALAEASIKLQPSALQRTSVAPTLWQKILEAWQRRYGIKQNGRIDVENMTADFVNSVLFPQAPSQTVSTTVSSTQMQPQQQNSSQFPTQSVPQQTTAINPFVGAQHDQQHQRQTNNDPQIRITEHTSASKQVVSSTRGSSSTTELSSSTHSRPCSSASIHTMELFKDQVAHLLTDPRRFHAPQAVLERAERFFKGPPLLDLAAFEGSTVSSPISIPFPDIMDSDTWRVPVTTNNSATGPKTELVPIQSCFLHVPVLPSKRRYETDTEVILLDDVRLAGHLNSKLWEEFSNGNVLEAITLVPSSATWFGKTELADWPCVVMSGLKFEQANGTEPSGKKYSEVHSYIVVYLGRDPLRQTEFVQIFQDLGISPGQTPEGTSPRGSTIQAVGNASGGHHRWIAGFRRLFRAQGTSSAHGEFRSPGTHESWKPSQDDEDSIDPQFDDIYSILPPSKKPRLERTGRPSDTYAAWHHSKRRKTDEAEFSKLKDPDLSNRQWEMDDYTSGSDSDYTKYWIDWFLGTKGNEYFCEVDEEYILDRFNLTGLNTEVQYYSQALDLITDNLDENLDEDMRDIVEKSARHLYGLIHARFIITTHGLTKMLEKFKKCDFGRCPRVLCHNHPLLPVALSDIPYTKSVKLFCCRCEDIYNPKSTRHASIDGAYFGCSFPHMLFQVYPQLVPPKSTDRYVPRIFGFKLHDVAKQHRYQDMVREESHARIMAGIEGLPTTAAQGSSRDGQQQNHKSKAAAEGSPSVATESGAMADVN
ncbi:casein kinase 2 regulatory subunit [Haplosporangium sp. Z 767]|nr:casein kinase 2 regulatory subunit [Haplosporangium sp. Z 11]KAF9185310.1 casein kinase 2 regulatory subunit [Haplosporangium sp. Z 767]